jgi:hypothetical protein
MHVAVADARIKDVYQHVVVADRPAGELVGPELALGLEHREALGRNAGPLCTTVRLRFGGPGDHTRHQQNADGGPPGSCSDELAAPHRGGRVIGLRVIAQLAHGTLHS